MSISNTDPVSSKLPAKREPKRTFYKDSIISIETTRKNLKVAGMDAQDAAKWRAKAEVGKYLTQQGAEDLALCYLADNLDSLKRTIAQCEKTLALGCSDEMRIAQERAIISCRQEVTKVCERIQAHKKNLPNDLAALAPKISGPPPRENVTAQQVNVFVDKKSVP